MPKERKRLEELAAAIEAHIGQLRRPSTPDEWDARTLYELNRAIARANYDDVAKYLERINPQALRSSTLQALANRLRELLDRYDRLDRHPGSLTDQLRHGRAAKPLLELIANYRPPKRKPYMQSQTIANQVKELYRSRWAAGAPKRGLMKGVVHDIAKRHGVHTRKVHYAMARHGVSERSMRSRTSKL